MIVPQTKSSDPSGRKRLPRHAPRTSRSGVPIRRDPHSRLMTQIASLAGENALIRESHSRPWASATFVGAQHFITLEFSETSGDTPDAQAFIDRLPEAEFSVPGHIVADATIDSRDSEWLDRGAAIRTHLRLAVLTIEDW